jgi:hypothetical protein
MSEWLDSSDNANCFKQTYVQGFVDISGGSIITRGPNDGIVIGGDSSLNGTVYLGDSMYVRSDGLFPGTADNGATAIYVDASYVDVSGQTGVVGVAKPDITGGPGVEGSILSTFFQSDASWSQLGFDIDGEAAGDRSGNSVSLINSATYGRVVAIGAPYNNGIFNTAGNGNSAGHVRVYQHRAITETSWTNYNKANTTYAGKPIVIGASSDTTPVSGKKYWVQLGADIDGEAYGDLSGYSAVSLVDASGGLVIAIGAVSNDGTNAGNTSYLYDDRGHVRVYQYDASKNSLVTADSSPDFGPIGWRRLGKDIDGEAKNDRFGRSAQLVDASGGLVVAIGANQNDGTYAGNTSYINDNRGHVRVYQYRTITETNWTNYNIADASYNGIAPYNKPIVVGASGDANPVLGKKYWVQMGGDIDGEAAVDFSSQSISLVDASGGLVVAIGASSNDTTTNTSDRDRGHVRVYQYDATKTDSITDQNSLDFGPVGWRRLGADIDGEAQDDWSGWSVSLVDASGGLVVAIGAYNNDTVYGNNDSRGHARVYQHRAITETSWTNYNKANTIYAGKPIVVGASSDATPVSGKKYWVQLGADIDGEATSDLSGYSVSLVDSSIGLVVAIGANQNDGTPVFGNRGHVRIYQYDASKTDAILTDGSANFGPIGWNRLGGDIDGEAAGDESGYSVSLADSADGLVVAIGAPFNDSTVAIPSITFIVRTVGNQYTIDGFTGNFPQLSLIPNTTYYFDVNAVSYVYPFALKNGSKVNTAVSGTTNNDPLNGRSLSSANKIITYTPTAMVTIVYEACISTPPGFGTIKVQDNRGHVRVYEIPYTKSYSDVSGGYYDVSVLDGYLNDGKTTAALYVNGDTDLSGGLTVSGDVSFNAGNLFVAGDLSLNGNLFINGFAPNYINADAIDSTVNIEFANKLSVSTSDLSFNKTALKVATDFSLNNTLINLATNLTVPANIAIVDGSNGTVYGSYLTLTNKDATAYYNVGKSASGIFNIVDQANAGVYLASGGTSFTGTSDARLKTNIAPLESATDKIMALNPCTYQWKSDADNTTETKTQTKTHVGFIAQEVEKIMPELVHPIDHPAGPDYKGVNTTDLIPYLVRMIQEQNAELDELADRLTKLSA